MKLSLLFFFLVSLSTVLADAKFKYEVGDKVDVMVSKVGPYANPSETYRFYSLPYCRPDSIHRQAETLGEVLEGDRIAGSLYDIHFRKNVEWETLCKKTLKKTDIERLYSAVEEYYYFEMLFDDLPMWNFVGIQEVSSFQLLPSAFIFTHHHFNISYNENRVVGVSVMTSPFHVMELDMTKESQEVSFTYSVSWNPSTVSFSDRHSSYTRIAFFPREIEIHWLSIMNSFILMLMLVSFLAFAMARFIKKDFSRYATTLDDDEADLDEFGWKLLHGDVFRFPCYPSLFSSLIGLGTQFFIIMVCILGFAFIGVYYPYNRGSLLTSAVIFYVLSTIIATFVSANLYRKMGGQNWLINIALTIFLYVLPLAGVWFLVNSIAVSYQSTAALPFGTVVVIFLLWSIISLPLSFVGAILGRNISPIFDAPVRTKNIPREIPQDKWYKSPFILIMTGGLLPFSSIYIELYYLFASVWGHRPYTLWGVLAIVFVIVVIVTAALTVAMTYMQLSAEDHRWWWRSFLSGASTGVYIIIYSVYYWTLRSEMSGTLQAFYYFGYIGLSAFAFSLMLGTVGWFASLIFVKKIYSNLKYD